jgi:hypothetical protein
METRSMMVVMALALFTSANAQTTPTTPTEKAGQDPAQPVRSQYNDCLLSANNATWSALGLNSDQMSRIAEVQTRYKTYVQPPKETADAKKHKGKKGQAVKSKPSSAGKKTAETEHLDKSAVNDAAEAQQADPGKPPATEAVADNTQVVGNPDALAAQPASFDEELRGILTPEQWAMWDKRCAETSMR